MQATGREASNEGHTRIVVGVDGSAGAACALRWAVAEAKRRGAGLEVVHAWHYFGLPTPPFLDPPVPGADTVEVRARRILDHAVDGIDDEGLVAPIERILAWEQPASALLEASKGADLLVVGSRGRGGFRGLLLGSVSQEVAHHAKCPVVIIPKCDDRSGDRKDES
jgi:nucleotide-binding universal stress UspA family protein